MASLKIFDIAGSGMAAESVRLNTVASNIANANSVASSADKVYKPRQVVFEEVRRQTREVEAASAVRVKDVVEADVEALMRYEPGNPVADTNGYVYAPNISAVDQMVDMIAASRSYQNNIEVMNTSRELMLATLRLGQ
ncbi:MAG: flagellar basal body rod protein FlgC [Gammaproteobacteria bacterium]|jgi:flagellar basal-body rod protein FlgC|nr:flagellar basal body rod protein FlgC [Gammaproteobacteria bacterium]